MLNLTPTEFSATALYEEGRQIVQDKHKAAEKDKLGILRGGSAGFLMPNGEVIGKSPWEALARLLGFQMDITAKTFDIFDGGFKNEAMWDRYLKERGTNFTGEEAFPLKYAVGSTFCTGRPDAVILTKTGDIPVFGIENKGVMSKGAAEDIFYGQKPKDDNFIQSCHYSYKFNLPWILVYTSNSVFQGDFWTKKKYGETDIPPFNVEFKIGCENGKFYYITEAGHRVDTVITTEGIDLYYEAILESKEQKDISWMRMADHDIHGVKRNYDLNIYNDLCLMVPINTGFDNWLAGVKKATSQSKYIKAKKINKELKYKVFDGDDLLEICDTLGEAREMIFGEDL